MKVKKGANALISARTKYSSDAWNKKKTVKTYSKSRPCHKKLQSSNLFDEVFATEEDKEDESEKAADDINKENEAPLVIQTTKETNTTIASLVQIKPFEIISKKLMDGKLEVDQGNDSETNIEVKIEEEEGINSSPKNSTCIEGGARIENQHINEPALSPIPDLRIEKTNMDNISMELTNPCDSGKANSSFCLSTVGGSTPYILAALRVKKSSKSRKASMAPFIKQRLKNLRGEKLLRKASASGSLNIFKTRKKEKSKESRSVQSSSSSGRQSRISQVFPKKIKENELDEGSSPIIPGRLDPETTPEDKNLSILLKKDPASIRSRRSLSYVQKRSIPIDCLLTEPVNVNFKKVKVRIKRNSDWLTHDIERDKYPIDILQQ